MEIKELIQELKVKAEQAEESLKEQQNAKDLFKGFMLGYQAALYSVIADLENIEKGR